MPCIFSCSTISEISVESSFLRALQNFLAVMTGFFVNVPKYSISIMRFRITQRLYRQYESLITLTPQGLGYISRSKTFINFSTLDGIALNLLFLSDI